MEFITRQLLESGLCKGVGLNRDQAKALGITWPLVSGWKDSVIGKSVHRSNLQIFMELSGLKAKKRRKTFKFLSNQKSFP